MYRCKLYQRVSARNFSVVDKIQYSVSCNIWNEMDGLSIPAIRKMKQHKHSDIRCIWQAFSFHPISSPPQTYNFLMPSTVTTLYIHLYYPSPLTSLSPPTPRLQLYSVKWQRCTSIRIPPPPSLLSTHPPHAYNFPMPSDDVVHPATFPPLPLTSLSPPTPRLQLSSVKWQRCTSMGNLTRFI